MELTFIVAVKNIWQLQPSWLHSCKVCEQGRSIGKLKFSRSRKMLGGLPAVIYFSQKVVTAEILKSRTLNGAF